MPGELAYDGKTGILAYALVRNRTSGGMVWNGAAFEVYSAASGNQASYPVAMSEQAASAHYVGNMPAAIPAGTYDVTVKQRVAAFYADGDPVQAAGQVEWNGLAAAPLSDTASSGQLARFVPMQITRGVMVKNFPIYLKSSADHITPLTSGIISGQIQQDAGSFTALASGAYTEVGQGHYNLQAITSGETNAGTVRLLFTAVGVSGGAADPLPLAFLTQRTSGL